MAMSSEERRRRLHLALKARKREEKAAGRGAFVCSFEERDEKREAEGLGERFEETRKEIFEDQPDETFEEPSGRSFEASFEESLETPSGEPMVETFGEQPGQRTEEERAERSAASDFEAKREPRQEEERAALLPPRFERKRLLAALIGILILLTAAFGGAAAVKRARQNGGARIGTGTGASAAAGDDAGEAQTEAEMTLSAAELKLQEAERLAAMYDYDAAIALLQEDAALSETEAAKAAIASYATIKESLVRQDIYKIPHIFFHILMVDPENALNAEKWGKQASGYNSLMTTIPEFEKMLNELYEKGYVLVRARDLASMQEQEDGSLKMTAGDIMLPPEKKALVMSEDDVCYYEYMEGAGFADRMIVGEDGRPTCVYTDSDGVEHVGEYDLVPILDRFIDEHPDFSYRGAKAIIAFTGYNGILGYRTDETYDPNSEYYDDTKRANPNIEADRETARAVVRALKADGYELASHSWGHRDMGQISLEHLKKDTDRWERNVNQSLLEGSCDILIYPKGADVGDWRQTSYSHTENEKFDYLWKTGFRYFFNVDNNQYWVQKGDDFLRQGRRALDGYNMWLQISGANTRLSDLFDDVSAIFDARRPTPVSGY